MERLTDRKTAENLKSNYEGLRAKGQPRNIDTERYIKLAEYENDEEFYESRNIYICDPERNEKCKKSSCWLLGGCCRNTIDEKSARLDADGQPIRARI